MERYCLVRALVFGGKLLKHYSKVNKEGKRRRFASCPQCERGTGLFKKTVYYECESSTANGNRNYLFLFERVC